MYTPVVEVVRGGVVESLHYGAVAVADADGRLVAHAGDPQAVSFLRSTAKPLQALPLVESGAAAHFGFSPKELAIVCGSHGGTDEHVAVLRGLHRRMGLTEDDLLCGVHPPHDKQTAARLQSEGAEPTPYRHNCSGKHTGMLALARFLHGQIAVPAAEGQPPLPYIDPRHPAQQMILQTLAAMAGISAGRIAVGIDGCSAPTFAMPLLNTATAFARLVAPAGVQGVSAAARRAIAGAMAAHPDMVRMNGGFDTELMRARPGLIISKGGAEGYLGVGLAPGAAGPNSPALGLAVKIADGDHPRRALTAVTLEALRQLGALEPADHPSLAEFSTQPTTNWRGLRVGETRVALKLARA